MLDYACDVQDPASQLLTSILSHWTPLTVTLVMNTMIEVVAGSPF